MATYVLGDLQGCLAPLERLLARLGFDGSRDRLWLAGDLVNRGSRSLDVLRWARDQGEGLVAVLGNHDLHLLAVAAGARELRRGDTLDAVLAAPDRDELLDWLRARPLLHSEGRFVLVHAGLLPPWTLDEARARARAAEAVLRHDPAAFFAALAARDPDAVLPGGRAIKETAAALTRLRVCTADGQMDLAFKEAPDAARLPFRPWFAHPRASAGAVILFGHWAALGLHCGDDVVALDTGCVWGGSLTAYRLEDGAIVEEPCQAP